MSQISSTDMLVRTYWAVGTTRDGETTVYGNTREPYAEFTVPNGSVTEKRNIKVNPNTSKTVWGAIASEPSFKLLVITCDIQMDLSFRYDTVVDGVPTGLVRCWSNARLNCGAPFILDEQGGLTNPVPDKFAADLANLPELHTDPGTVEGFIDKIIVRNQNATTYGHLEILFIDEVLEPTS